MTARAYDYDAVAAEFDRRYELHEYPGLQKCLREFVAGTDRPRVLEVGCGTGRWLALCAASGCEVAGIEPSDPMLVRARARVDGDLRCGAAEALPWPDASFDRVVYVNALHHFASRRLALGESWRVLRPGGKLLSIGLDPHHRSTGRWYVYEYFPAALAADLERFPSRDQRTSWLRAAGFVDVVVTVAERMTFALSLDQALHDGVLQPSYTSQLGVISPEEYEAGMQRIRASAAGDDAFRLEGDLELYATEARRPA